MKTYINRRPINGPWGGGALFQNAFWQFADGDQGVELLKDPVRSLRPNVILLSGLLNQSPDEISAEQAVMYRMYADPTCKIVLRVNENDARKGTTTMDQSLLKLFPHMDGIVFVSNWLRDYFHRLGWQGTNDTVIVNGVDGEIFKPGPKFDNGKLNIVAHHWSDNPLKGADIYEQIDRLVGENPDQFSFTYIGRHRCNFKHTKHIKPLYGKELGEELGKYDAYVSASRFDPGPNHVLEALACGLPTYVHKDGGGAVEFAGLPASYESWVDLKNRLTTKLHPTGVPAINLSTWQTCVQEYNRFLVHTCQPKSSDSHSS